MSNLLNVQAALTLDSSQYEQGLGNAEKRAGTFGTSLKKGVGTIAKATGVALAAAGTAAVAFGTSAVKTGMEFDKSMSAVEATMGDNAHAMMEYNGQSMESIDALRQYAQEMGRTTAFSASQASDALGYMALAGYDAQTSISMLPNVLNLAAAGDIELAYASDMVTDAQSALGLSIDETSQMVDQMAMASSKSNTSVSQLGEAILTIGATARGVKGGTTELSTVLGVLADNGIKGAEGGTHLRNAILSLQTPTKDGTEALAKLGLSYEDMYDSAGNMRALPEIFLDMQGRMEGMTQASKDAIISGIFNKTDLAAVNALIGTSSERWDELTLAIEDSSGAAQHMANVKLDNLAGDITIFKSALEGAKLALSAKLTPAIRNVVQYGTKAIERLTTAFDKGGFKGLVDELTVILSEVIGKIVDYVPKFIEVAGKLLGALVEGIIKNLPKIATAALQIVQMLGTSLVKNLPMILGTIMQVVSGLADMLIEAIPMLIPAAIDLLVGFVGYIIDNIDKIVDAGVDIVVALVKGVVQAIPKLVAKGPELVSKLVEKIKTGLPNMLQGGKDLIVKLGEGMSGETNENGSLTTAMSQIVGSIGEKIKTGLPQMLQGGKNLIVKLGEGISGESNEDGSLSEAVKQSLDGITEKVLNFLPNAFNWGKTLIVSLGEGISGESNESGSLLVALGQIVKTLAEWAGQLLLGIAEWFLFTLAPQLWELMQQIWEGIKGEFAALWAWIVSWGSEAWPGISNWFTGLWNDLVGWLAGLWERVSTWWSGVITDIKTALAKIWEKIKTSVSTGVEKVKTSVSDAWDSIKTTAGEKIESIKTTVSEKVEAVKEAFLGVIEKLKEGVGEKWEAIKEKFSTFIETIKGLFNFSFEWPHIPLPHFSVTEGRKVLGVTLPKIGVEWYKKAYETPYLFNEPTIVGRRGFGDGGGSGEMVYGRDALMKDIRDAVGFGGNVTINVYQREGEDTMALSRRIEQDLIKIMRNGKAGALYV